MRIAILDDDADQAALTNDTLTGAGHTCHTFEQGQLLLRQLRRESFDLLVLDWNVPDLSGAEVLAWVRQNLSERLPVLFVSSRARESDIVTMLNAGADDYVVKPVSAGVLTARVASLLRRSYPMNPASTKETFGNLEFDLKLRQVSVDGNTVSMTQKEFDLALLLFQHLSRPLSRAHILDAVWKQTTDIPSRTLDTHIAMVRTKLALRPENGFRLTPIYGYGYRLEAVGQDDANASADATANP
ncbi:DNA-binding response regulator [Paraburkholderia acidicola]|uniref:DNA-binding response regulator n=1 Tax=Paraburkholderia acidicola TaxID=1912599 RepID=A0A2A4EP53_9BURK|nr:response regulator transcription factor [Paraburkholderia acidicola]PCE23433.1 DNA-binding response regulator [Paraburkholderia acidicola]